MASDIRYSDEPVLIGALRYVGDAKGGVSAHIVTGLEEPRRIWDDEYKMHRNTYPYCVRPATADEEAAYLAGDRYIFAPGAAAPEREEAIIRVATVARVAGSLSEQVDGVWVDATTRAPLQYASDRKRRDEAAEQAWCVYAGALLLEAYVDETAARRAKSRYDATGRV